jgi:hypothetical protein
MRCDFVSPEDLQANAAVVSSHLSLNDILSSYGKSFSRSEFSSSSPLVFKADFSVTLAPGDYNVLLSMQDKELSISNRRTLHVIVPSFSGATELGDLMFCQAVGSRLDSKGKPETFFDPNPWRQISGAESSLIVAYRPLGAPLNGVLKRRHSIWRLRGDTDSPLWTDEGPAPAKRASQHYLAQVPPSVLRKLDRGVYVFKVELWEAAYPARLLESSKTFEVHP